MESLRKSTWKHIKDLYEHYNNLRSEMINNKDADYHFILRELLYLIIIDETEECFDCGQLSSAIKDLKLLNKIRND